jgi:hypothetical protein
MQAITVRDRDAGIAGLSLTDPPYPAAAEDDVRMRVHAVTPWGSRLAGHVTDRVGHDRPPSVHDDRSAALVRAGGTLATIAMPPQGPAVGRAGRVRRRRTRPHPARRPSPRG